MKTILSFPFGGMGAKAGPFSSSRFFADIVTSLFDVFYPHIFPVIQKSRTVKRLFCFYFYKEPMFTVFCRKLRLTPP